MRWSCSRSKRRTTNQYASQDLVDGRRSCGASTRGFDELFLFQGLQNGVQPSERYACRFGQYSYFRLNPYS